MPIAQSILGPQPPPGAAAPVDLSPRLEVLKTAEPAGRKSGIKVKSVSELVDKLKNEAGLI